MESTASKCASFAKDLGLRRDPDGIFIGRIRGFPIGLRFVDPDGVALLLFEIRHWLKADSPQLKSLTYDEGTSKLIAEKKIEIEFEDQRAWLTINEGSDSMENRVAIGILTSVLQALEKTGAIGDPDLCHYCRKTKVESVACIDGKVVQICPTCLDDRMNKFKRAATVAEVVPIFLMTP